MHYFHMGEMDQITEMREKESNIKIFADILYKDSELHNIEVFEPNIMAAHFKGEYK